MKIVKVQCAKSGRKAVLQLNDAGTEVMGFYRTDDVAFEAMQSEIRLNNTTTRFTCPNCGTNRVGSCEHKYQTNRCSASSVIDKNCLVCKYLQPDYSRARRTGVVQIRAGECAALSLSRLRIGTGWDSYVDIDSSVVLEGNGAWELVYFGNLSDRANCVNHRGDNRTGANDAVAGTIDDENIDIDLDRVPAQYNRLVFVINIYTGGVTSFGSVSGLYLNVYDAENNDKLIEYRVEGNYSRYASLVIGEARRVGTGWEFLAIGEGSTIKDLGPLRDYVIGKHW